MIGLLWEIFNLLKEVLNRTIKLPELLLTLAGLRTTKKLLLRVVVLRDERGLPLASNEEVLPAYEEARRILSRMAGVTVEPAGWRVVTAPHAAPKAAVKPVKKANPSEQGKTRGLKSKKGKECETDAGCQSGQ